MKASRTIEFRQALRALAVFFVLAGGIAGCRTVDVEEVGALVEFEFPFMGDYDVVNHTTFYWSDSFVTNNPTRYNHELAGPLAAIAASTYGSRLFMDIRSMMALAVPPERLMRCYEDNGTLRYRHPKYGRDVAGFTIGSRMCELPGTDFGIVIIAIRGTVGREDWLSNLNMANEWGSQTNLNLTTLPKYHEGFYRSAEFVMDALKQYVKDYNIDVSKAKFLVTGHSRGAATANLVGKMLDDAGEGPADSPFAKVRRENVYVYSIATPNVTVSPSPDTADEKYRNIYSVVSPEDIVPLVPFKEWHGARYGRTLMLKSLSTIPIFGSYLHPGYVGMKNNFRNIVGYEYWHMLWGTYLVEKIPSFAMRIAPTIGHYYYVKPEMREAGNKTSIHSCLEMVIWKNIPSSTDPNRHVSLMGDVASFAREYERLTDGGDALEKNDPRWDHKLRFRRHRDDDGSFNPDGRDFSKQPGITDVVWKITCMHAPATYISWLKSGVDHGPDSIYENFDEVCGERK